MLIKPYFWKVSSINDGKVLTESQFSLYILPELYLPRESFAKWMESSNLKLSNNKFDNQIVSLNFKNKEKYLYSVNYTYVCVKIKHNIKYNSYSIYLRLFLNLIFITEWWLFELF